MDFIYFNNPAFNSAFNMELVIAMHQFSKEKLFAALYGNSSATSMMVDFMHTYMAGGEL